MLNEYSIEEIIGRGVSAKVVLAKHKETEEVVALKIRHSEDEMKHPGEYARKQSIRMLWNEGRVGNYLSRKEIIEGIVQIRKGGDANGAPFMVMEYCPSGELFEVLDERNMFPEALVIFKKLMNTVRDLHAIGVFHRDLKLENIVLGRDQLDTKICDFGLAKIMGKPDIFGQKLVGSPGYSAPETLMFSYQPANDIWSMGCVLFLLLSGTMAFHPDDPNLLEKLQERKFSFRDPVWKYVSEETKDLISKILSHVRDRPTAENVLKHPCLQFDAYDDVKPLSATDIEGEAIGESAYEGVLEESRESCASVQYWIACLSLALSGLLFIYKCGCLLQIFHTSSFALGVPSWSGFHQYFERIVNFSKSTAYSTMDHKGMYGRSSLVDSKNIFLCLVLLLLLLYLSLAVRLVFVLRKVEAPSHRTKEDTVAADQLMLEYLEWFEKTCFRAANIDDVSIDVRTGKKALDKFTAARLTELESQRTYPQDIENESNSTQCSKCSTRISILSSSWASAWRSVVATVCSVLTVRKHNDFKPMKSRLPGRRYVRL